MNTYKLTLIAMLAAIAVTGRIVLANIPNIQPVTAIIIITGFWLGPWSAISLAVLTTLVSNILLGMGYWTIWQIIAWSGIGLLAGFIGRYWPKIPFWGLSIYGFFSGFLFGFMISLTMRSAGQPFWAYYLAGLPFDLNHAIGNVLFILALSPLLSNLFLRYQKRNVL